MQSKRQGSDKPDGKAMISGSLRTIHDDTDYYFCRTQSCPEVCFSSDGQQTFNIDEIREHVYQKEPDCPYVLMCYCFQYSVEDIKTAGDSVIEIILTDINTGIKNGQCACDLRNPQGSCCLGNIQKLIRRLE